MFPPDYSHGEVLQEKWMLWQEIEGMETLDTNVVDEDHCYTSQQCLLLNYR